MPNWSVAVAATCTCLMMVVLPIAWPAGTAVPAGANSPSHQAAASTAPSSPLTLLSQTPWLTQGKRFVLQLEAGRGTPPPSQLGVSVAVYPCLSSVSGFEQSVAAVPSGSPISATDTPLPVSSLPSTAGGGFELSLAGDDRQRHLERLGALRASSPSTWLRPLTSAGSTRRASIRSGSSW